MKVLSYILWRSRGSQQALVLYTGILNCMHPHPIWSHKGHYSVLVSLKHAWRVRKGANSKHCCIKMVFPVLKLAQKMLLLSSMHCTNHTHAHAHAHLLKIILTAFRTQEMQVIRWQP